MSGDNMDRAIACAKRYAELDRRGDVVLRDQERRTIEDLIGEFGDGRFQLPAPVADAMGRPELGPRYAIVATHLDWNGEVLRRETISTHTTRDAAETAAAAHRSHSRLRFTLTERGVRP